METKDDEQQQRTPEVQRPPLAPDLGDEHGEA